MNRSQPPSTKQQLLQAVKEFPEYVAGIFLGLLIAVLTQVEMTLFVVFGVLVGFATHSAWTGAAITVGVYIVFYVLHQYVGQVFSKIDQSLQIRIKEINDRAAD